MTLQVRLVHSLGDRLIDLPDRSFESPLVVGRLPNADVQVPDALISRRHCVLYLHEGQWYIQDGKGAARTFVNGQPALEGWSSDDVRLSHRRELFLLAADCVKDNVKEATWRAFWMTAVEDRSVDDVANTLGISVGAVYIARSRVLAQLRDEIKKWEDDDAM